MEFCKYHPLKKAAYHCEKCQTNCCSSCVNIDSKNTYPKCYMCQQQMKAIINSDTITPFWRRLSESFRYPMNMDSILLIVGAAVLFTITSYLPFSFIFQLLILGGLFKYCFSCLENTAKGNFVAPDVAEAYGSGFRLVGQVIFLLIAVFATIGFTHHYLGSMVGSIIAVILVAGLPAMIINFALTENIMEALNPLSMFRLISSIGLPYGLILAFILIMSGSVGVINQLISSESISFVSNILQSSVGNYYMIIIFQIMGYMIYQYQEELGFETNYSSELNEKSKSVKDNGKTEIDIFIKEGQYGKALEVFHGLLESYQEDDQLHNQYFELLMSVKDKEEIINFSEPYIGRLLEWGEDEKVSVVYQRINSIISGFKPISAEQRYLLAKVFYKKSNFKLVVHLINGMQKEFSGHRVLSVSFMLMADALDNMPNLQNKADQCRQLARKLELLQSKTTH